MHYKRTIGGYIIKMERGERVIETLTDFCTAQGIAAGLFHAIGAVEQTTMGYYSVADRQYHFSEYPDAMEVASMTGNIALVDDEDGDAGAVPFLHTHAVLSDTENRAFGGHVKEATVAVTLEVFMRVYDMPMKREYDEGVGLKLLDLRQ